MLKIDYRISEIPICEEVPSWNLTEQNWKSAYLYYL